MTSIMIAFQLALAKTYVKEGIIAKQDLIDNFNEIRKKISHQSNVMVADKEIMDFLGIQEERKV